MTFSITVLWDYLGKKEIETKIFISIFYAVGIFGMLVPISFPLFNKLIPFALILSAFTLIVFHYDRRSKKSILVFLFIYLLSFIIEVAGVNTGFIFGSYQYGNNLGFKLFNTPVIIGLNWLILVYITSSFFERYKIHNIYKIVIASSFMLIYDIILEQVAPKLGMWCFKEDTIPLQNYLSWFLVSLILHSVIKAFRIKTGNKLSLIILISQFIFFLVLATLLKR